jgi:hypothetical protein
LPSVLKKYFYNDFLLGVFRFSTQLTFENAPREGENTTAPIMDIPNPGADLCIAKWKCKGHYFNMATKGT